MRTVNVDFTNVRSFPEMHQRIELALEFPDYYGKNLDALWDCLVRDIPTPVTVVFLGTARLTADQKLMLRDIIQVFHAAKEHGVELVLT